MARTKWISRTVVATAVNCIMFNPAENTNIEVTITLSDDWTEKPMAKVHKEILKKVDPNTGAINVGFDNGEVVPMNFVTVKSMEKKEGVYWMTEDFFVAHAQKVTGPRNADTPED